MSDKTQKKAKALIWESEDDEHKNKKKLHGTRIYVR